MNHIKRIIVLEQRANERPEPLRTPALSRLTRDEFDELQRFAHRSERDGDDSLMLAELERAIDLSCRLYDVHPDDDRRPYPWGNPGDTFTARRRVVEAEARRRWPEHWAFFDAERAKRDGKHGVVR